MKERAATREMGPNDVSCIIWAICMYFFFLHVFYILTTLVLFRFNICFKETGRVGVGRSDKTGPNDVSCAVWALGVFSFFYYLSTLFRAFICIKHPLPTPIPPPHPSLARNTSRRGFYLLINKRAQTTVLSFGPCVFFIILFSY